MGEGSLGQLFQQEVDDLCVGAQYYEHPRYGILPSGFDPDEREWQNISDIVQSHYDQEDDKFVFNFNNFFMFKRLHSIGNMLEVADHIEKKIRDNTDFESFSFLKEGYSSYVMLGKSKDNVSALRMTSDPRAKSNHIWKESLRNKFPGLIQSLSDPINIDSKVQIEEMPFVHVRDLKVSSPLPSLMGQLAEDTCFAPDLTEMKEVTILPDHTILSLDPGECPYALAYWDMEPSKRDDFEARSIEIVRNRLQQERFAHIPEQLRWFTDDGQLKQDLIYGSAPRSGNGMSFRAAAKLGDDEQPSPFAH